VIQEQRPRSWSVGIYTGTSPFSLVPAVGVENPVLRREDVTDMDASLVADPFMVHTDDGWFMFIEVKNRATHRGEISLATSDDGLRWTYRQSVLREPFHLSFPQIFRWRDTYYMLPESHQANGIRLYRADRFPFEWSLVRVLLDGSFVDPVIFHHHDCWWMFACASPSTHDTLRLFHAQDPEGVWSEHPTSPVVQGDRRSGRCAGPVVRFGGRLFRLAQDCTTTYGRQVLAFEIHELTPTCYSERECAGNPVLSPSADWNLGGMHHLDPHPMGNGSWIACVDGRCPRPLSRSAI
jgi:hypothetical protein